MRRTELCAVLLAAVTVAGCRCGVATDAGPPPGTDATPPPGTDALPPPGTDATPPPGTDATPPPGTDAAPPPGSDAAPPPGTDAASPPGTDAAPPPGTDAAPPPVDAGPGTASHWGSVVAGDVTEPTIGLIGLVSSRLADASLEPIPSSLFDGTPIPGAPGCNQLPAGASMPGLDGGPLTVTGLATSPLVLTFDAVAGNYTYTSMPGGLLTPFDWSFAGGGAGGVPAFAGSDAPPDPLVLGTTTYAPFAHTWTMAWTPGNGTAVWLFAGDGATMLVACEIPDAAGTGTIPMAALLLVAPWTTPPAIGYVYRVREQQFGDPFSPGIVMFGIGVSGAIIYP